MLIRGNSVVRQAPQSEMPAHRGGIKPRDVDGGVHDNCNETLSQLRFSSGGAQKGRKKEMRKNKLPSSLKGT